MIIDIIPLEVFSKENGFHANIELSIDGHKMKVLLDTGAPSSRVQSDKVIAKYKAIDKKESKGVSGVACTFEVFQPKYVKIGSQTIQGPQLTRGSNSGILGLDLLKNFVFQYDLGEKVLRILTELPSKKLKIKRLEPGHLTIPMTIGNESIYALFDTGSDATVIDEKFINNHSNLFKVIRSETGTDHHGSEVESRVYKCSLVKIENLELEDIEVAGFEFPEFLREKMEGTPVILGNNIIGSGKWSFDLDSNQWSFEK